MSATDWFPAKTRPVHPGLYVVKGKSNCVGQEGHFLWRWWTGESWLFGAWHHVAPPAVSLRRTKRATNQNIAWRGWIDPPALERCAAGRDGECCHAQCPQLRDNEPMNSGRHCPLDVRDDED